MIKCSDIAGYCGKTDLQGTGKFGDALYGNSEKYIGVVMQVDLGCTVVVLSKFAEIFSCFAFMVYEKEFLTNQLIGWVNLVKVNLL